MNQATNANMPNANGNTTGISISIQLPKLHVSIGVELGWKARIAIIATDRKTPAHDMHPNETLLDFFTSSGIMKFYCKQMQFKQLFIYSLGSRHSLSQKMG